MNIRKIIAKHVDIIERLLDSDEEWTEKTIIAKKSRLATLHEVSDWLDEIDRKAARANAQSKPEPRKDRSP